MCPWARKFIVVHVVPAAEAILEVFEVLLRFGVGLIGEVFALVAPLLLSQVWQLLPL